MGFHSPVLLFHPLQDFVQLLVFHLYIKCTVTPIIGTPITHIKNNLVLYNKQATPINTTYFVILNHIGCAFFEKATLNSDLTAPFIVIPCFIKILLVIFLRGTEFHITFCVFAKLRSNLGGRQRTANTLSDESAVIIHLARAYVNNPVQVGQSAYR